MANKNGKGPNEEGSKTGRQMGNCKYAKPIGRNADQAGQGLGPRGRGIGRGRGFRRIVKEDSE